MAIFARALGGREADRGGFLGGHKATGWHCGDAAE